jgi:MYXO-CTERM domain-containing protein
MTLQRMLCCVLLLAGCADRQVDVDDDLPELLVGCMIITGRGYFEDGSSKTLTTEAGFEGGAPSVCMCMTKEELNEGIWAEELNELAYPECKRIEELQGFDWSDCQGHYESGEWLGSVSPAIGDFASFNYTDLDCDGEPDESCSITNPDEGDPMLALVLLVLLGLRRRTDPA